MLYTLLRTHMYRWKTLTLLMVLVILYASHMINFYTLPHTHMQTDINIDIYI